MINEQIQEAMEETQTIEIANSEGVQSNENVSGEGDSESKVDGGTTDPVEPEKKTEEVVEEEKKDPVDKITKKHLKRIDSLYKEKKVLEADNHDLRNRLEQLEKKVYGNDEVPQFHRTADEVRRQNINLELSEKITEAKQKYDDWDTTIRGLEGLPEMPHVSTIVTESEYTGDILYYFGKHPTEAMRIAGLPPIAAAREIGKVEAMFEGERAVVSRQAKVAAPIQQPAAIKPKPITPVQGTGSKSSNPNSDSMSVEERIKRQREMYGKRR